MKLNTKYLQDFIKKNKEFFFVIVLIVISVLSTQLYQTSKDQSQREYLKLINNLYFQKTVNNIITGFQPKYYKVKHKIRKNESLNSILREYGVSKKEVNVVLNNLIKNQIEKNLRVDEFLNLTIDNSNMTVSELSFLVSKTKKIVLIRDNEKNIYKKKEIVTNLQKKILFKEGKITQTFDYE